MSVGGGEWFGFGVRLGWDDAGGWKILSYRMVVLGMHRSACLYCTAVTGAYHKYVEQGL